MADWDAQECEPPDYGSQQYWEAHFASAPSGAQDDSEALEFEWLCGDWETLLPLLMPHLPKAGRILHPGCGMSRLPELVHREAPGLEILSLDSSPSCVSLMRQGQPSPGLLWQVADVARPPLSGWGSFDAVVEKGCLDALLCHSDEEVSVFGFSGLAFDWHEEKNQEEEEEELRVAGELWRPNVDAPADQFLPAAAQMGVMEDQAVQKARLVRLKQLLELACPGGPGRDELETVEFDEFDGLLCGGAQSSVLRSMMRRLGLDCRKGGVQSHMQRRLKEMQRRRDAASQLIDEMEREVLVLRQQMSDQAAELSKLGTRPTQDNCLAAPGCAEEELSREVGSHCLESPGPELRCELRHRLREAQEELCEMRVEVAAAQKVGASAWESVKQVLQDSQPEASLLDGRKALLAFARGKSRGTAIAEKLLDWDVQRKLLQAAVLGWKAVLFSGRRADRFKAFLQTRTHAELMEAAFGVWRHLVLQLWSGAAEQRLCRCEEIMTRISLRLLAGDGGQMLCMIFLRWRLLVPKKHEVPPVDPKDLPKEAQERKKCCTGCTVS
ncbi:unnamed protein product [Effrenium voratum]|uniref:Uncharacterized protein n=1 Tax=Effrenium voratum TaxID=2562239 RepID=A0AA36N5M8_9DINO|nr:unnamed protein product [Effrenium voratum]